MSNQFISPKGIAKYPHFLEPDTQGKFPTGKYSTKLIMSPADAKPLIAVIDAMAKGLKSGDPKLPYKFELVKDGEAKKKSGNIQFSFSSKFAPVLMDGKNQPINLKKMAKDFDIGSGSTVRIAGELYSYDTGISLQMQQVQLLDLVNGRESKFDADDEGTFDGSEYEDDSSPQGSFTEQNVKDLGI